MTIDATFWVMISFFLFIGLLIYFQIPQKIKTTLDFESMIKLRLVRKNELVKILGRGELKGKVKISAHKFTATAKSAIEAAGGEAVNI